MDGPEGCLAPIILFSIICLVFFIIDPEGCREAVKPPTPVLTEQDKLNATMESIRKSDDAIRRSKGLPPKDPSHYKINLKDY